MENKSLHDQDLSNGPVYDRGCTDIFCCLLFTVFLVTMVGVAGYGVTTGNPMLLITPFDKDGNGCGLNETTKEYPKLYFPSIDFNAASKSLSNVKNAADILKYAACVKECPRADVSTPVLCKPPQFMKNKKQFYKDCVNYPLGVASGKPIRYDTIAFGGRFCVPDPSSLGTTAVKAFTKTFEKYFGSGAL
jgi:hypothetical protein